MNATKGENGYYVRFTLAGRNYCRQSGLQDKKEALKWGKELRQSLKATPAIEGKSPTLRAMLDLYKEREHGFRHERTLTLHVTRIQRYLKLAGHRMSDFATVLTPASHDAFLKAVASEEVKPSTANTYVVSIKSFLSDQMLRVYADNGWQTDQMEKFRASLSRIPSPSSHYNPPGSEVIEATLANFQKLACDNDPELQRAVWLALAFGLRRSEIVRLKRKHVIHEEGRWLIDSKLITKNGEHLASVPGIHEPPQQILDWLNESQPDRKFVLSDQVFRRCAAWMRRLGWQTIHAIHELRAYSGSQVARRHDIYTASRWLRHSSVTVTERCYARYLGTLKVDSNIL